MGHKKQCQITRFDAQTSHNRLLEFIPKTYMKELILYFAFLPRCTLQLYLVFIVLKKFDIFVKGPCIFSPQTFLKRF